MESNGKKKYEIEKEELILHLAATRKVEELVAIYKESEEDSILIELGEFVTNEIINNTEDKSGSYTDLNE